MKTAAGPLAGWGSGPAAPLATTGPNAGLSFSGLSSNFTTRPPGGTGSAAAAAADDDDDDDGACDLPCPRPEAGVAQGIAFCNSLDWDAPLQQRACASRPELCAGWDRESEEAAVVDAFLEAATGPFELLVHYHYHETPEMPACEQANKRTNLEVFIRQAVLQRGGAAVEFHFSSSGSLPPPADFFRSIGQTPTTRGRIFPDLPFVHHQAAPEAASTDLCHHGRFLAQHRERLSGTGKFVMLINDCVRGPVISAAYAAAVMARPRIAGAGVPPWFVPFLYKHAANRDVLLVSTMISAELEVHGQSYAAALHSSAAPGAEAALLSTCGPDVGKHRAILDGEVGASLSVLDGGFAIAGLWPRIDNLTSAHARCITGIASEKELLKQNRKPHLETCHPPSDGFLDLASGRCSDRVPVGYHLLNRRGNPVHLFEGKWSDVVFIKHGGTVFRQHRLKGDLSDAVQRRTAQVLGIRKLPESCSLAGTRPRAVATGQ